MRRKILSSDQQKPYKRAAAGAICYNYSDCCDEDSDSDYDNDDDDDDEDQAGTTCGASSQADLTQNLVLKMRMLRFSRHSRQKCRKQSFLRQKRAFLASNIRSASQPSSYEAGFPED